MQPSVSVIVPTYNTARFVVRAVESVLSQTFTDLEIIVVDDGSTDDTHDMISRFADPRLHYVYQENRERSAARNTGIRLAQGQYVAFLDADDILLPNMLSVQTDYLERHPRAAFVHGYALKADPDGRIVEPHVLMGAPLDSGQTAFASLLMGTPILIHTTLIRRSCLDTVGYFDETLAVGEDWDLWLRLAARYEGGFSGQPVAVYSVDPAQHPAKLDRYRVQQHIPRMIERAFTYLPAGSPLVQLKPRALARAHVQWGACVEHALGRGEGVLAHLQEALKIYPALASDVEVIPKGVAQFALWSQDDGETFIHSFFYGLPASASALRRLERSTLVLYYAKQCHLAGYQRQYRTAAVHLLRAVLADPTALTWASRQFLRRIWNQRFARKNHARHKEQQK